MRKRTSEFSADDWRALYLAHRLVEQICLHGKAALDNFIAAAAQMDAHRLAVEVERQARRRAGGTGEREGTPE